MNYQVHIPNIKPLNLRLQSAHCFIILPFSGSLKLEILKFVCLCQFDENAKFKGDFNSQFGPQDLRFQPLGRDFDSSQYWFICVRI